MHLEKNNHIIPAALFTIIHHHYYYTLVSQLPVIFVVQLLLYVAMQKHHLPHIQYFDFHVIISSPISVTTSSQKQLASPGWYTRKFWNAAVYGCYGKRCNEKNRQLKRVWSYDIRDVAARSTAAVHVIGVTTLHHKRSEATYVLQPGVPAFRFIPVGT